jgi:predicted phosphoribosyltransferase
MVRQAAFRDRADAGRQLARHLRDYAGRGDVVVVGLPRGGVPVAFEVARELGAPLDVFIVRKIGFPGHEELAIGAVASGGMRVMNDALIRRYALPPETVDAATATGLRELELRERELRGSAAPADFSDRAVIAVDDGLATGVSMRAAARALREHGARQLVVAVPVASREACALLAEEADAVVCARTPERFDAVGAWYDDFAQTSDGEVRRLLARSGSGAAGC